MENDTLESGVENVQESSAPESESPAQTQTEVQGQEASAAEKPAPFHEHPRFKELIDSNRTYKQELETMRQQLQEFQMRQRLEMEARQQASQPKQEQPSYDELWQRLNGIDPVFAKAIREAYDKGSKYDTLAKEIEDIKAWRTEQANRATANEYESSMKKLHEQYKVPDNLRSRYEREVQAAIVQNRNLKLSDLPNLYKSVHEDYSKFIEDFRRTERESYVKEKKKDAAPTTPSGGTPAAPKVEQMSREEAIKHVAGLMRQAKQQI